MSESQNESENPLGGRGNGGGPPRKPGQRAVRPRDAATLIIVRRDAKKPRLLMGRRAKGHDFMPDKWVFPGGRIDRSDFNAPYATDLSPEVALKLMHGTPERRARALALTAIRETFEEAGLLLAKPAPERPGAGPWREFLQQGAAPDLAAMQFVARAVTPPMVGKRFDARFFMAEADRLMSLERQADCGELDEIAWVDLDEALALDLPGVTRFVVREVAHRLEVPERPIPYMRFVRKGSQITHL
ncbi:NUDIX hydrolase [Phenylobacterium sp.]|uniref:NUDIX hydrolase n=1 Tax=Phenylobacterium sp. TaxID=1871053 RepID=UPI003BACF89D